MKCKAFTMIELVFVIVIMGIIGKFGVEFLAQSYKTFIQAKISSELHTNSTSALQFIAKRLEFRIVPSTIKRSPLLPLPGFQGAAEIPLVDDTSYNILEWISYDIDGYRGTNAPLWSGIVDLDPSETNSTNIFSPGTDTDNLDDLIKTLSNNGSSIADAAIMFSSDNYDPYNFGWDGGDVLTDQNKAIHPINSAAATDSFATGIGANFSGMKVSNRYMLAWTAYALVHEDNNLTLHYDYQPWQGESYDDGKSQLLMQNVSTFRIKTNPSGGLFSIMVCAKNDLIVGEEHSICKEKVIF